MSLCCNRDVRYCGESLSALMSRGLLVQVERLHGVWRLEPLALPSWIWSVQHWIRALCPTPHVKSPFAKNANSGHCGLRRADVFLHFAPTTGKGETPDAGIITGNCLPWIRVMNTTEEPEMSSSFSTLKHRQLGETDTRREGSGRWPGVKDKLRRPDGAPSTTGPVRVSDEELSFWRGSSH